MKKLLAFILTLTMVIGILSGCGKTKQASYEDTDEQVTLRWVMPWYVQTDFNLVQDKVNEKLAELMPNTKLELICDNSMGDKWQLWMAGKQSYDIAHTGFAISLPEEISKKSFIALDDLIEKYAPTIKEEREKTFENLYVTGEYKGSLYGIPCVQYHTKETVSIVTQQSNIQYLDVDALTKATHSNPKTTEEVYKILDDYLSKIKSNKGSAFITATELYKNNICKRGYVFVGGNDSNICYDPYAEDIKIIDFYETEEYKTYIKWANKWYNDGYINKDILTGTSVGSQGTGGGISAVTSTRYGADDKWVSLSNDNDGRCSIILDDPSNDILASHNIGSLMTYLSIPVTAENPARAMKLLELLRTEKGAELLNLIAYGEEGTHYEKISENIIKPVDYVVQGTSGSKYGLANWMVGNLFNMDIVYPYDEGVYNYGKNYFENVLPKTKKSPLFGYCFDTDPVSSKMSALLSVNKEYEDQLAYGVVSDYTATYNEMITRLKSAGMEDIIKEFQKQANDYVASNK